MEEENKNTKVVKILHIGEEVAAKYISGLIKRSFEKVNFLYDSIIDNIYFYELDQNRRVYCFFDVYFLVISTDLNITFDKNKNVESKNKLYKYHNEADFKECEEYFAYYMSDKNGEDIASMAIRNSKTLKANGKNSYDNYDIKAIFDARAFVILYKFNQDDSKFYRQVILFILGIAYNKKMLEFLNDVYTSYKNKDINKMVATRDDFLGYDLSVYFTNPVKPQSHQTYEIWGRISDVLAIKNTHNEIKSQISDLVQVIYNKRKDAQDRKWTIFGIAIAALSLLSGIIALIK